MVASPKGAMIAFEDVAAKFAIVISVIVLMICLNRATMFALTLKSWSFVGWLVGSPESSSRYGHTSKVDFSGAPIP